MYSQLFYLFTSACVLCQVNAHFGISGTVSSGGTSSGSLVGDLLRAGGNVKYQLADVADNAATRIRGMFHKKTPPNGSVGFQTGYVIQATPYANSQPPVNAYGSGGVGTGGGGINSNFGYNIGVAPAGSYDSYRPSAPSGSAGGRVDVGASVTSTSGSLLGDDHLEYVSATGERRRLTYDEVVQLITIVVESSKGSAGTGGFTGGFTGVPAGGYAGAPTGGYTGAPTGGYAGAPTGGYAGAPTGGFTGASAGGFTGVPAGGYAGAPTGGYTGAPTGGYAGASTGGFTGASAGGFTGASGGGYAGAPTGGYTGGSVGVSFGGFSRTSSGGRVARDVRSGSTDGVSAASSTKSTPTADPPATV